MFESTLIAESEEAPISHHRVFSSLDAEDAKFLPYEEVCWITMQHYFVNMFSNSFREPRKA